MAPKFVFKDADDESYFKGEKKPFPHCKTLQEIAFLEAKKLIR